MAQRPKIQHRALLLAALAAIAVIWLILAREHPDLDDAGIRMERARRLAYARAGTPLPGTPDLAALPARLAASGTTLGSPVLLRIFKREFELEIWTKREARFEHFATYPVCRFSGGLGPKLQQGDKQAPEGFYTVDAKALNPKSRWHRSFNLGFPNAFDRAHQRTGTYLMVHGGCSSAGCYAMTNAVMDEIWQLVTAALKGGQKAFQVQVFPFRMGDEALARYQGHLHHAFWSDLKRGHDLFLASGLPPRVRVCSGRYEFDATQPRLADGSQRIEPRCAAGAALRGTSGTVAAYSLNSDQ